ncbi:MAG TPA: NADH-quinone oxidoreductase subunit C [Candidatus Acidoferrales bacterium]|nr:NADH-quinone oxidoreductase subunit C [Candidatus Acidoferrales bacterium]
MAEKPELEQNPAIQRLRAWNSRAVSEVSELRGEITVVVPRELLLGAAELLRGDTNLLFNFLSDLTCVDRFPNEPRFELNYHLLSLSRRAKLRIRVRTSGSDPVVPSLTSVWPGINWHERETFDLFGVRFEGHPDLRRILMPEDWEGHPLRKDFPVEGFR